VELVFTSDARIGDGSWANNPWMQELPHPVTQLTWDNAALIAPALASRLQLANDDVIELRVGERALKAPVWIVPGMPDRSVTLAFGYGRTAAGEVANGRGVNAYPLRTSSSPWLANNVTIARTGNTYSLACAQTHHAMEGRDIVRLYSVD